MPRDRVIQELPDGSLQAPDGVVYRSTPERLRRKSGNQLVESGAVIVTKSTPKASPTTKAQRPGQCGTRSLPGWSSVRDREYETCSGWDTCGGPTMVEFCSASMESISGFAPGALQYWARCGYRARSPSAADQCVGSTSNAQRRPPSGVTASRCRRPESCGVQSPPRE